jgi:hypothetical protein
LAEGCAWNASRASTRLTEVQVKTLTPDFVKWDGISLAEAVKRCMDLSPHERAAITIFAPSGLYSGKEIEALFRKLLAHGGD